MHIEYLFCFICSEQYIKSFRRANSVACLVLYSRKLFLITQPLVFKKWVGELNPSHSVDGISTSNGIALTITKSIDSTLKVFLLFCLPPFTDDRTKTSTHILTYSAHGKFIRVIPPSFWFTKFISIQRA